MIVLDASAAVHYLCGADAARAQVAERIEGEPAVHVPTLFELEVLQALRGLEAADALSEPDLGHALTDLGLLRRERYDHRPLLGLIWQLRHNLTTYDAAYVALASALEARLVTADRKLARSSGHDVEIEAVNP